MTTLCWLVARLEDLPPDPGWLSAGERETARTLRVEKRRQDWLLGRYTAKLAVATYSGAHGDALARWEIRADRDGAPRVWHDGRVAGPAISLSHSGGQALCVVAPPGLAPGCDLERIEPRGDAFVETFFTARECAWLAAAGDADQTLLVTLLWSAKESALKALRHGLRKDTRSVDVTAQCEDRSDQWQPLSIENTESSRLLHGWWRTAAGFVLTVAADHATTVPRALEISR